MMKGPFLTSSVNHFRVLLFIIGLSLTLWRAYQCLEKFNNFNHSTKVGLKPNSETVIPAIVNSPTYHTAYNKIILNKHGFENRRDYLYALESNDSSVDSKQLFLNLTPELKEIVQYIKITFTSGDEIEEESMIFKELR